MSHSSSSLMVLNRVLSIRLICRLTLSRVRELCVFARHRSNSSDSDAAWRNVILLCAVDSTWHNMHCRQAWGGGEDESDSHLPLAERPSTWSGTNDHWLQRERTFSKAMKSSAPEEVLGILTTTDASKPAYNHSNLVRKWQIIHLSPISLKFYHKKIKLTLPTNFYSWRHRQYININSDSHGLFLTSISEVLKRVTMLSETLINSFPYD